MKVRDKVFAIIADDEIPLTVSLKCEPDVAVMLRSHFPAVIPGYHLNKRHWNTVILDGTITKRGIKEWIDDSYDLISDAVSSAPLRARLGRRRVEAKARVTDAWRVFAGGHEPLRPWLPTPSPNSLGA